MIKWMLKYDGNNIPVLFSSIEEAEDYAMIGFESKLEALCTWATGTPYQKRYNKELDRYFKYEIVKCRIEVI